MLHITLIGAGNVGCHLGRRLVEKGFAIGQVFSRNPGKARELAEQLGAAPFSQLEALQPNAGLYILAVSDDAVGPVAQQMSRFLPADAAVVHTSGATPSTVLAPFFRRHGVFYPLQTFSRQRAPDFDGMPLCIFSPEPGLEQMLAELGLAVGGNVHRIDDAQRAVLHVAAVFVNNFSNHLFHIGQEILEAEQLDFEMLRPLILETALKAQDFPPREMQTGPARRGDTATIGRHLEYLKKFPKFAALYELLTESIREEWRQERKPEGP